MEPTQLDLTAEDGTSLNLWELSPEQPRSAVVFLHGAMTCSRALFAPPVEGDDSYSWLNAAAEDRAACALDVRGYGDSERPPELEERRRLTIHRCGRASRNGTSVPPSSTSPTLTRRSTWSASPGGR